MKILKPGCELDPNKWEKEIRCSCCECIFLINKDDVSYIPGTWAGPGTGIRAPEILYVNCPHCATKLTDLRKSIPVHISSQIQTKYLAKQYWEKQKQKKRRKTELSFWIKIAAACCMIFALTYFSIGL